MVSVGHRGLCAAVVHWPVVTGLAEQRPCMVVHEWHKCSAAKYSSNNGRRGNTCLKKTNPDDISLQLMNKDRKGVYFTTDGRKAEY